MEHVNLISRNKTNEFQRLQATLSSESYRRNLDGLRLRAGRESSIDPSFRNRIAQQRSRFDGARAKATRWLAGWRKAADPLRRNESRLTSTLTSSQPNRARLASPIFFAVESSAGTRQLGFLKELSFP